MLFSHILSVMMLLSWGLLLAATQCPRKCGCRIADNIHYVNCYDRDLDEVSTLRYKSKIFLSMQNTAILSNDSFVVCAGGSNRITLMFIFLVISSWEMKMPGETFGQASSIFCFNRVYFLFMFLYNQVPKTYGINDRYEIMNISQNRLHELPSFPFEKFPGLTTLNLSSNFLFEVRYCIFQINFE
jgi:hypothetical protein